MPLVQNNEMSKLKQNDYTKIGKGIYLNPYSGSAYYHHKKGTGLSNFFKGGIDFFKNHIGTIADAASAAASIADVVKTAKEIKKGDEELYELQRIKHKMTPENKFTPAQKELMNKLRKSGNGIKIV